MDRSARAHRYDVPNRKDIAEIISQVFEGEMTREEVSEWAAEYMLFDNPQIYPEIEGETVWNALVQLAAADHLGDGGYLYGDQDLRGWKKDVEPNK